MANQEPEIKKKILDAFLGRLIQTSIKSLRGAIDNFYLMAIKGRAWGLLLRLNGHGRYAWRNLFVDSLLQDSDQLPVLDMSGSVR